MPAGITDVPVAHKVGIIPMNLVYNDAGIIYDKGEYVLAITTSGFSYEYSQRVIASIASMIHKVHKALS
ncbi:serine hydrolase [Falsibacillus pallidus]|uniref:serine hydrolase n=1 Tax=Falsibacillus pallidus TaxID=493781 RepID=UPI003D99321F